MSILEIHIQNIAKMKASERITMNNYPYIEKEDIQACLEYAALVLNAKGIIPANAA